MVIGMDVWEMEGVGWTCVRPQWPQDVSGWSGRSPVRSTMTDELAADLGGLGDSLSVCDSRGAPGALTSSCAVIEFTIVRLSTQLYVGPK